MAQSTHTVISAARPVVAFVGGGNMAAAMLGGLLAAGWTVQTLRVAEPDAERRGVLAERLPGLALGATAAEVLPGAGVVVVAVKPQVVAQALAGLAPAPGTLVISIAAGVRLATFARLLGGGVHLVRTMPNTPALLRAGISGLYAGPDVPAEARALAETVMASAGETLWVDTESDLDAVTALSGSGPAYVFLLSEAMALAGVRLGLDAETAERLARATVVGSGKMLAAEPMTPASRFRANVTSKGGTTEAAVGVLKTQGFQRLIDEALAAARRRGAELGDALEPDHDHDHPDAAAVAAGRPTA